MGITGIQSQYNPFDALAAQKVSQRDAAISSATTASSDSVTISPEAQAMIDAAKPRQKNPLASLDTKASSDATVSLVKQSYNFLAMMLEGMFMKSLDESQQQGSELVEDSTQKSAITDPQTENVMDTMFSEYLEGKKSMADIAQEAFAPLPSNAMTKAATDSAKSTATVNTATAAKHAKQYAAQAINLHEERIGAQVKDNKNDAV